MEDIVRRYAKLVQLQKLAAPQMGQMPPMTIKQQYALSNKLERERARQVVKKFVLGSLLAAGGFYGAGKVSKYVGKKFPKVAETEETNKDNIAKMLSGVQLGGSIAGGVQGYRHPHLFDPKMISSRISAKSAKGKLLSALLGAASTGGILELPKVIHDTLG